MMTFLSCDWCETGRISGPVSIVGKQVSSLLCNRKFSEVMKILIRKHWKFVISNMGGIGNCLKI